MKRIMTLVALFVFGSTMLSVAQPPPGTDPDAKGTVSLSVKENKNGIVKLSVTRGASTGWKVGGVIVFAMMKDGGVIYDFSTSWAEPPGEPATTTEITINLPNGTFDLWALHTIAQTAPPNSVQDIGSALVPATVTNSAVTGQTPGGIMLFSSGSPTRVSGGAGFKVSGSHIYTLGYGQDPENALVHIYTIPTGGGLMREMTVPSKIEDGAQRWHTDPNIIYVPSQLTYNVLAATGAVKNDGTEGHAFGKWAKNK